MIQQGIRVFVTQSMAFLWATPELYLVKSWLWASMKLNLSAACLNFRYKLYLAVVTLHTASFWNITIQWTSHDDLTEKLVSLVFLAHIMMTKKLVKRQKFKTALCDLTKKLLPSILSGVRFGRRLWIDLEAKRMDESSWKKCFFQEDPSMRLPSRLIWRLWRQLFKLILLKSVKSFQ